MDQHTLQSSGQAGHRHRIAVLDDNMEILVVLKGLLSDEGYEVSTRHFAQGAHDWLKELKPSLVILDIMMESRESGWEVLQVLKLDPETKDMPVIVSSAAADFLRANRKLLDQYGCHILHKPFDLVDVLRLIEVALDTSST